MANSINTNYGAQIALQNLNSTNRDLNVTQNRVSTGLKVASAKDNGAIWSIASAQKAEMGALDSVKSSMQRGKSIIDVSMAAGDSVMAALTELKGLAVSIKDALDPVTPGTLTPTGQKLVDDFNAIAKEVHSSLAGATFDGVNLFNATTTGAISVTTDTKGSAFTLKATAQASAGSTMTFGGTVTAGVWAPAAFAAANYEVTDVESAITSFTSTLADLGTKSKSLDRQLTFTSKLQDSIEAGVGNLVDADLAKESARLTALQTKQQLGVQALSIANQSSGILLSLFR